MPNIFFHSNMERNTAVLRAVCQVLDLHVASSFIFPKVTGLGHHTRHRWTRPQDVDTPNLPAGKEYVGFTCLPFFRGQISEKLPKSCGKYSKISYVWVRSKSQLWDTKKLPETSSCTQVTWSVSQHLPGLPSPHQWRSNDNEGPAWWPAKMMTR